VQFKFSRQIFEKHFIIKISWKSVQWEPSSSMRVDGRTEMTKPTVGFRSSANVYKNQHRLHFR